MRKVRALALLLLAALNLGACGGGGYIRGDGVPLDDAALGDYCARNPASLLCGGRP